MAGSWLRLDVDYLDDARLWEAGWEATALWPAVLTLLKVNDGVLDDRTFSGAYLARKVGCPRDVADAGVEGIRRTGLLVEGVATWKVHKGLDVTRRGWLSTKWAEKGNAPASWNLVEPSGTFGNLPEPSGTLGKDSDTLPNDSRARCPVPSVDGPGVQEQARAPVVPPPEPKRVWNVAALYGKLAPRYGRGSTAAPRMPDSLTADRLLTILDACADSTIDSRLARCAGKSSPLAYFVALFNEDGTAKPERGKQQDPSLRKAALNDAAERAASALHYHDAEATLPNIARWCRSNEEPWTEEDHPELLHLTKNHLVGYGRIA